jgi:hypothetical protein
MLEAISYGGQRARGFALGSPTDPDIFPTLTHDQQQWIQASLVLLNSKVMQASGTSCASWTDPGVNLRGAVGCFQTWYNANYTPPKAPGIALRTDGTFDKDTLAALTTVASMHPTDFNVAYPSTPSPLAPSSGAPATGTKKLSTGQMVGIGVAGAAVVGGIAYAATRKKSGRRRR